MKFKDAYKDVIYDLRYKRICMELCSLIGMEIVYIGILAWLEL